MSVEKSIILKCRQAESSDNLGNGNWKTNLKRPVLLEQGDVVKIHTAILDTSADAQVIVESDVDPLTGIDTGSMKVSMTMAKYITWYKQIYDGNGTAAENECIAVLPATGIPIDYQKYFATFSSTVPANTFVIEKFLVLPLNGGFRSYGDCQLTFRFTDPVTGLKIKRQKRFKGGSQISHLHGIEMKIGWQVVCQVDPVTGRPIPTDFELVDDEKYLTNNRIDINNKLRLSDPKNYSAAPVPAGSVTCAPYLETISFNITAGRYTPGEIATVLNDNMGKLNTSGINIKNAPQNDDFPVENPFLTTVRQATYKLTQPPYGGKDLRFFQGHVDGTVEVDLQNQISFNTAVLAGGLLIPNNPAGSGRDIILGAEQASINYDPVLKKLNFDILHTPMYVGGGGQGQADAVPGIIFNDEGGVVRTFSGVAFTDLEPVEFWTTQLGFQSTIIDFKNSETSFNAGGVDIFGVKFFPITGLNITDVFDNMDLIVPKDELFYNPSTPSGNGVGAGVATSLTKAIVARREFGISPEDEGYFLIEIGFKFPQSMVGGAVTNANNTSMNNIQSIVGKYYTGSNNFLQDTGAGSITYEHHGSPQLVSDLSIRILNPNGTVPQRVDLGEKNSIFLEILKTINIVEPDTN